MEFREASLFLLHSPSPGTPLAPPKLQVGRRKGLLLQVWGTRRLSAPLNPWGAVLQTVRGTWGNQNWPWALSLPDKELCLREALAVCSEHGHFC